MTILGDSAGAGSIAAQMVMPSAKGLFRRATRWRPGCASTRRAGARSRTRSPPSPPSWTARCCRRRRGRRWRAARAATWT
ncbi:carboxylesterase family protein [Nonomuraea phyllanthi]|uniref:Carboxylesterase family protein n=1 Tax=Nonomuraea phyllanthi TaxID=2219224 RepID=A0A5C4WKI4_9ACTN|nr:carboxylesterase family protein [Nonomuraea phyllanthi]KAB8194811.1 carboxylesterase family protein [Nonomuraea phyllanthi]QFY09232.1 carboxylesterase family protein [Nonomuraea phyllanthi]